MSSKFPRGRERSTSWLTVYKKSSDYFFSNILFILSPMFLCFYSHTHIFEENVAVYYHKTSTLP